LFCGGGGAATGLSQAGYESLGAIDYDPAVIDIYNLNHPTKAQCLDILDLKAIPKVDLLWISPPCCSFSGANVGGSEGDRDTDLIIKIVDLISRNKPLSIVVENVAAYRNSRSYSYLKNNSLLMGFQITESLEIASDYGAATSRKRFISRMSRNPIRSLEKSEPKDWIDWIPKEIESMPVLPLTKNQSMAWDLGKSLKPAIIERCGYRKIPKIIYSRDKFPTIRAHSHYDGRGHYRVAYNLVLENSPALAVSPRLLGLIQGFPETYDFGDNKAQACKVVGNSVSPPLAKAIGESVKLFTKTNQWHSTNQ
jgi:DNA (cytosine-5)-methyltransferase 1